jgi:hypothetical protein
MKQLLGLVLQIIGYVALSWGVLLGSARKYINFPWEKKPIEIRLFLNLIGIKDDAEYNRLFSGDPYPTSHSFTIKERLILDIPLIALVLIILGSFLSLQNPPSSGMTIKY